MAPLTIRFISGLLLAGIAQALAAQTGTFIDRWAATDLRVVSYNIHLDDIFPDDNPTGAAKFARVMQALQPDIINLQEIYEHTASQTVSLINSIVPSGAGPTWYAYQSFDNVLVSKYPLSLTRPAPVYVPANTSYAMALVDLPDAQFNTDFYYMNSHFKCCSDQGWEEGQRQQQADALVNWMRDARTPGEYIDLPAGTPMAVVGDLNLVQTLNPLNTLVTGDIVNEGLYGADSPPDWDGTSLGDAHPVHNGAGSTDWTYRSGGFPPSRLDYVLYSDSVVGMANRFVLNTVSMTAAERAATGLQQYDVTLTTTNYDHIPVVVDFRFAISGDFNDDGAVDALDYQVWQESFGSTTNLAADANHNHVIDAGDYAIWRKHFAPGAGAGASAGGLHSVPGPGSCVLLLMSAAGTIGAARRLRFRDCSRSHVLSRA
jgi:endonuclease/exonuclease/phosphatase family metal-dependent hydrolase